VPSNATPTQFSAALTFQQFAYGSDFSPGWLDFSVSSPTNAPGGGQSNTVSTAFLSAFNTAFLDATFASSSNSTPGYWQLDQTTGSGVGPYAGGNGQGAIPFFVLQPPIYDAGTTISNLIQSLGTEAGGAEVTSFLVGTGTLVKVDQPLGIDALNKIACVSQDMDAAVTSIDLSGTTFPTQSVPLGEVPWNVEMTSLASGETNCVVFDAGNLNLSVLTMPSLALSESVPLSGLTPIPKSGAAPVGGWQLAVFSSGPAAGTAAVLSQADDVVVFVNLLTGHEIRRVTLSGSAIRIAADSAHGNLIVAIADTDHLRRPSKA